MSFVRLKEKFKAILGLLIGIAILSTYFGWPDKIVTLAFHWGISAIIGAIMSGISEELVEIYTGDTLKNITIPVPIAGYNFSITLFFIVTIVVRYWLF